jgi:hypothetical protein
MSIVVSRRSVLPQQIFITLMPEKGHPEAGKPDFVKLEQGLIPIGKGTLGVRDNTHPYSPDIVRGIADVFVTRAINAGLIAPSAARNNLFPAPLSPQP